MYVAEIQLMSINWPSILNNLGLAVPHPPLLTPKGQLKKGKLQPFFPFSFSVNFLCENHYIANFFKSKSAPLKSVLPPTGVVHLCLCFCQDFLLPFQT